MLERRCQSKILCFQIRPLLTSQLNCPASFSLASSLDILPTELIDNPQFVGHNLSISLLQLRARFSIDDAPQLSLALVVKLLSLGYPNFKFDFPMLDVNTRDNQSHPVCGCRLIQLVYFAPMQQELSRPQRIVIVDVAVRVGRDMRIE